MEIIFMFAAAIIIVIVAFIGIVGGLTQRVKKPAEELTEQVTALEKRVSELEKKLK